MSDIDRTSKTKLMGQWNPLLAQLEGAAEAGASVSSLVLQSLVAQSARVVAEMQAEIERLEREVIDSRHEASLLHTRLADETSPRRSVAELIHDGHEVGQQSPVQPVLGTDREISDDRLKWLIRQEDESAARRAFIELWERRSSPLEPAGKETVVTPLQGPCDRCEATGIVGVRHALCGGAFRMPTEKASGDVERSIVKAFQHSPRRVPDETLDRSKPEKSKECIVEGCERPRVPLAQYCTDHIPMGNK
jgi:hypothetical protein